MERIAINRSKQQGRRRRLLRLLGIGSFGTFGYLTLSFHAGAPRQWEISLGRRLQAIRWLPIKLVLRHVSVLGFAPLVQLVVLGFGGLLWSTKRRTEAIFLFGTLGAVAATGMAKLFAARPRPNGPARGRSWRIMDYGYPSGHTVHYVTFYGFLFYLAFTTLRPSLLRSAVLACSGALVTLIGASRIYRGDHWPGDVLGGYPLGLAYLIGLIEVYRRVKAGRSIDKRPQMTG